MAYLRERSEDDVFCPEERPEVCVKKPPLHPGPGVWCGPQLDRVCGDLQKEKSTGKPSNHAQAHAYHQQGELGAPSTNPEIYKGSLRVADTDRFGF